MNFARVMLFLLALSLTPALSAQGPIVARKAPERQHDWTVVRIAKWALLGGAVGLGAYALSNSRTAERAYADIREHCSMTANRCAIEDGQYVDAGIESLYRRSVNADRRAQIGIYGGQVAILGSVGLFIYDLRNGRGPSDIPYPSKRTVAIGARLNF